MYKYYIKISSQPEKEVDIDEFIYHERIAKFTGPGHYLNPRSPATHSFHAEVEHPKIGLIKLSGRVEYVNNE